ncbi:VAC7 [Candida pseudojiufengensis]|uniref:VAC7 n=1 Tax=Candida pseudojiufengensis TaxID=497109 RepID=UPI00222524C0|nr:VAC7 [Candida pseudojiufengensis]KAI5965838.1 VAC7 [Candida pseudojiufengensis]
MSNETSEEQRNEVSSQNTSNETNKTIPDINHTSNNTKVDEPIKVSPSKNHKSLAINTDHRNRNYKDKVPQQGKHIVTTSSILDGNVLKSPLSTNHSSTSLNQIGNISQASHSPSLNKNSISNINKSLKAKQKIIHSREPHPKNPTLISNIINKSPQSTVFPILHSKSHNSDIAPTLTNLRNNNSAVSTPGVSNPKSTNKLNNNDDISKTHEASSQQSYIDSKLYPSRQHVSSQPQDPQDNPQHQISQPPKFLHQTQQQATQAQQSQQPNFMNHPNNSGLNMSSVTNLSDTNKQSKHKKIAKQSSTKTDFFAAKLASAVDDVESSDSDETFVYENDNDDDDDTPNQFNILDNVSVSGSIGFNAKDEAEKVKSKGNKAPSIVNSMTSASHLEPLAFKRQNYPVSSSISISESDNGKANSSQIHHTPVIEQNQNQGQIDIQNTTIGHSIGDIYRQDDAYSYNEIDDDMVEHASSEDDAEKFNTVVPTHAQISSLQHLHAPSSSTTHSVSSKNTSRKNCKSSTTSSKLRSTTSKLFDKKGSQPRRYSTIPDDIDIEDFDDELIYYDNNVKFPHANESSSLLKNPQKKIPHYRSLNMNPSGSKRQRRYLSTGQPLSNSDHDSNKNIFPFPYNDNVQQPHQQQQQQQHNFYYDIDDFDQNSNRSYNFDLPDLPMHKKGSRNFTNNNHLNGQPFYLDQKFEKRSSCIKSFIYTLICIVVILSVGFILGFVMATTKDLTDVGITSIENPIVSKDELVFNIVVEAFNPGWFNVDIKEVELDLFARSGYLPDVMDVSKEYHVKDSSSKVETVKLGTITSLESEMNFEGGFFSREPTVQKGEIKLLNPGKNVTLITYSNDTGQDNTEKWEIISENPFDLIITGVLKYELPLGASTKSVVVRKTGYIDPTLYYFNITKSG